MAKYSKLYLVFLYIIIIQIFMGCSNVESLKSNDPQVKAINYIGNNLDEFNSKIKEKTGFEGKIVNEEDGNKETKYLEFDIDDITKIKFETNGINVMVVRQLNESNVPNPKKELTVKYISTDEDAHVIATLKYKEGSVPVDYKANNFDKPLDTGNEKYEQNDLKIKAVASTEELNKLTSTVHSIYNVLEEIYKQNNVK